MITNQKKNLIVLAGPTAVGKTATAITLSKYFCAPIVSCDSRQFYTEMSIGTAKPSKEELNQAPHFFIGSHSIHNPISAGEYEKVALRQIEQLHKKHSNVIITGGSGLFIDAVCKGFDDLPEINPKTRLALNQLYELDGIKALQKKLIEIDPKHFKKIDSNNPTRLIRALELCIESKKTIEELRTNHVANRPFDITYIVLNRERSELYQRINNRVDIMMRNGLLNEVKNLVDFKDLNTLNTLGYNELFDYIDNKNTLKEAVELIKKNTRRYAKRQLTWFRRNPEYNWSHPDKIEEIKTHILHRIK